MPPDMSNPDVRWKQRFQNFQNAFRHLADASDLAETRELSGLEQQGLIKAFEFAYELAWNTLKDFLEVSGTTGFAGPRPVIQEAFAVGIIEDGETWMAMIKSRNDTAHGYDEDTADKIAEAILGRYVAAFETFQEQFRQREAAGA